MSEARSITRERVEDFLDLLRGGAWPADPKGLVDLIAGLEDVKSAACAVQAEAAVAFDAARRAEQAAAGVPAHRQGRGIANEVALARKEAPARGQVLLGLGKILTAELRHTLARLRDGSLNEFRATLIARETACLDVEHRIAIDQAVCADPARLDGVGTRELIGRVKRMAAELDPAALAKRARRAETDRNVTVRPAPDTMTYLTALLPVARGVAVYAALTAAADQARAAGDPRSKGQLMADLLYARTTGNAVGHDAEPPAVPVAVTITVPATTLAGGHDAATLHADGVAPEILPAEVARLLLASALKEGVAAWFRQVYVNPKGRLIGMSSKQRHFPSGLADFLAIRGQGICASPWCDAPIRHADHIQPANQRGPTTETNGQGLCEACNHAKQAHGWQQHLTSPPDERQQVETITPTGHRYRSTAPPPVCWRESAGPPTRVAARGTVECVSAVDPAAPESLASLILDLLHQRRAGATICPSDAARAAASGPAEEEWRPLMEPVRQAALTLVHQGKVEITQGGEVVDLATARGPIRIRLTGEDSVRDAEAGR